MLNALHVCECGCTLRSFMTPVSCHKLWNDVKAYNDREHFETPYVAKFHRCSCLAPGT